MSRYYHKIVVALTFATVAMHVPVGAYADEAVSGADPFVIPVSLLPTEEDFSRCVVANVNSDGYTWEYSSEGYFKYSPSSVNAANDWLFIPVELTEGESALVFSLEMRVQSDWYDESFEVGIGSSATPEAMTVFMDRYKVYNEEWQLCEAKCTVDATGTFWLGIHAYSEKNTRGLYVRNIRLDTDNAKVPQAPVVKESSINRLDYSASVELPSATTLNEAIEGNVVLNVAVDGTFQKSYVDLPGATVDVTLTLESGLHTIAYTAYIESEGESNVSEAVEEPVQAISEETPTLPFTLTFETEDDFNKCTVFDYNWDGDGWVYDPTEQAAKYRYSENYDANDWLVLPAIYIGKSGTFDLSVEAKAHNSKYPESFEVCIGNEANPAAMTTTVIGHTIVTNTEWNTYSGKMELDEGEWYIGIHATSEKYMYYLYLKNIVVTDPTTTGIESAYSYPAGDVIAHNGTLSITGFEGVDATVYSLDGKTVAKIDRLGQSESVAIHAGIYIVKVGDKVMKIIVR